MTKKPFDYSPSIRHHLLMNHPPPRLAYDGTDVGAWQRKLRKKLRTLIGLEKDTKGDLKVRSLWKRKHRLGTIEKIVFSSQPGADVPAYVCLPDHVDKPYPFMICLQGHTTGMHNSIAVDFKTNTKAIRVPGDRDFALACMKNGMAALCIEQRCFGERRERVQRRVSPHGCHDAVMHSLMLGRTLLGERVYDVDRGIDYLAERGDADLGRIGVMGDSGGGTVSIYSAALLSRIGFVMPACSFCTFADSLMSIYHCADNYVPGILNWAEMADIMGLFAPKPVVIVTGRTDPIFPPAGVRRAFRKSQEIYRSAGVPEKCKLVMGDGGHRFFKKQAWPVLLKTIEDIHKPRCQ